MKKLVKVLFTILVTIAILLTAIYAYYGGFKSIVFEVKETGGEIFIYKTVVGDYNQTPIYMDSVYYTLLNEFNIDTTKGAGLYYDNPQRTEKNRLRSDIGCILNTPLDSAKIASISQKFKVKILPKTNYILGEFPYKGMISVIVGIMRVYPELTIYMEENGYKDAGPVTEIYDVPEKKIIYRKEAVK